MNLVTVLLPNGPTVMIHKGWQPYKSSHFESLTQPDSKVNGKSTPCSSTFTQEVSSISVSQPQKRRQRKYQFINLEQPGNNNVPEVLKAVRRHVRKEFVRKEKQRKEITGVKLPVPSFEFTNPSIGLCLIGHPTACSEYPINMSHATHELLSKYLTYASSRMFPVGSSLRTSPLKSPTWFQFAVTDAAMFHAMLYAAAVYSALLEGMSESRAAVYHQNHTILILQTRLSRSTPHFEDSTLGAISCLAIGAAVSGDVNIWHMHMRGLKQMIRLRGNFHSLSPLLQAKLRRSDVTGAVDYGLSPYLDLLPSAIPPIWSILPPSIKPQTSLRMTTLLKPYSIHHSLIQVLTPLSLFTQTLNHANTNPDLDLSPESFSNDLYSLEHSLLSFPSLLPSPAHESALSIALRFSTLIYLKAVLQEFPHSFHGSRLLVGRVRGSLEFAGVAYEQGDRSDLVPWMCILCAAVTDGEVKDWFLRKLQSLEFGFAELAETALFRLLDLRGPLGEGYIERIEKEVGIMSRR